MDQKGGTGGRVVWCGSRRSLSLSECGSLTYASVCRQGREWPTRHLFFLWLLVESPLHGCEEAAGGW